MALINDPNIQAAYGGYEQAANTANQYVSAAAALPAKLKDAINQKLDYNKDLIEQKNKYAQEYFQAPSEARATYVDPTSQNYIFNPFQAEKLVSQYTNQRWQPYQTASDVLTQRLGSIQDIIGSASNAFQGQANVAQNQAQLARQKYEDLVSNAKWEYEQTHKGSGSGFPSLAQIQAALNGQSLGNGRLSAAPANSKFYAMVQRDPEKYITQLPGDDYYAIVESPIGFEIYKVGGSPTNINTPAPVPTPTPNR